jgi:hypothetical protein
VEKTTQSPAGGVGSSPVLDVPAEKMREAVLDAYRLRPDRRLLLAVAQVHQFITSQKASEALAEFSQSQWHISCDGQQVGTLPELPDFPDMLALLDGWAKRLNDKHPPGDRFLFG